MFQCSVFGVLHKNLPHYCQGFASVFCCEQFRYCQCLERKNYFYFILCKILSWQNLGTRVKIHSHCRLALSFWIAVAPRDRKEKLNSLPTLQ
jgi:hypothetical protein